MASAKTIGRTMGVIFLLQIVISTTAYFGLLDFGPTGTSGFLANAALYPDRMSLAAILLIGSGFLSVARFIAGSLSVASMSLIGK